MSIFFFFFFNDTATTEIYTLPLHDALPIYGRGGAARSGEPPFGRLELGEQRRRQALAVPAQILAQLDRKSTRLNSSHSQISYAVFCLKKKKKNYTTHSPQELTSRILTSVS